MAEPFRHLIPARARRPRAELLLQFAEELRRQSADVVEVASNNLVPQAIADHLEPARIADTPQDGGEQVPGFAAVDKAGRTANVTRPRAGRGPSCRLACSCGNCRNRNAHAGLGAGKSGVSGVPSLKRTSSPLPRRRSPARSRMPSNLYAPSYGRHAMPRSLNFISGPSRTGDIGGRIVLGAHGPRRLAVIVVKAESPAN